MHKSAKKLDTKNLKFFFDINPNFENDKNYFLIARRKISSEFDRKGAKKFLSEKEKALQKIVLDDSLQKINDEESNKSKNKEIVNKSRRRLKSLQYHSKKKKIKPEIHHFPTFGDDEDDNQKVFVY